MKRSVYGWILEAATLLSLIWSFYPLYFYGQADRWGDPSVPWSLPFIALMFYVVFFIMEKYYPKLNYPIEVTEKNAESLYGLMLDSILHLKFMVILLFAYISNIPLLIAFFHKESLVTFILFGIMAVMMIVLFTYIFKMMSVKNK